MQPKDRIIVAIDNVSTLENAQRLIDQLCPHVGMFKVGLEFIHSPTIDYRSVISYIKNVGSRIMLDAKLPDIPTTMGLAARNIAALGVDMFTVHASSGLKSVAAAAEAKGRAKMLAVTLLSSFDEAAAERVFGDGLSHALPLALDATDAGADGIICAPRDLRMLARSEAQARQIGLKDDSYDRMMELPKITPGVRPAWASSDDQARAMTPAEAIEAGATYLVIGRPITSPPNGIGKSVDAVSRIIDEIASVR